MLKPIVNPNAYVKLISASWIDLTDGGVSTLHSHAVEGTAVKSTGEAGGSKFLREDGDGTCSWQAAGGGAVEGTAVLSTGEAGGTKYLREDGDGTCSWQAVAGATNYWSRAGTVLSAATAGDDVNLTGDLIASDVFIGNNAAATDPTLNFITSGNDLTITYDESIKQLKIPSQILMQSSETSSLNYLYIFPAYTLSTSTIATGITLTPEFTPAAGSTAISGAALFGYTLIKGTTNYAAGSVITGLDYGNIANLFVTSGHANLNLIGINVFGAGVVVATLTAGDIIGLKAGITWGGGTVNATNAYGVKIIDGVSLSGTITNQYQLYVEKPSRATNKYQVVLVGNGASSGIWFDGTSGERLYSDGTNLISVSPFQGSGGFKSSDGSAGSTGTITLAAITTITVKNGLITAYA